MTKLMNRVPWRHVAAGAVGGAAGLTYYFLVGCDSS